MSRSLSGQRRAYWFPLALLGFLLLGWTAVTAESDGSWFAYAPMPEPVPFREYTSLSTLPMSQESAVFLQADDLPYPGPPAHSLSWVIAVVVVHLVSVSWYALSRRRSGESVAPARLALVASAGGLALVIGYESLFAIERSSEPWRILGTVGAPLMLLGLCALGWATFGSGSYRRTALALGVSLTGIVVVSGLVGLLPGTSAAFLVTIALLLLAWSERSILVAVVGVLFLLADVVFPPGPMPMLAGAAVMFGGVIAALLQRERPAAASP